MTGTDDPVAQLRAWSEELEATAAKLLSLADAIKAQVEADGEGAPDA